jgi:hypothetical protein
VPVAVATTGFAELWFVVLYELGPLTFTVWVKAGALAQVASLGEYRLKVMVPPALAVTLESVAVSSGITLSVVLRALGEWTTRVSVVQSLEAALFSVSPV